MQELDMNIQHSKCNAKYIHCEVSDFTFIQTNIPFDLSQDISHSTISPLVRSVEIMSSTSWSGEVLGGCPYTEE